MDHVNSTGDVCLEKKDLDILDKYSAENDEIGHVINTCTELVQHTNYIGEMINSIADGDLPEKVEVLSDDDTAGLAVRKLVDNLNILFEDIHKSISQVASDMGQITNGALALARESSEQIASIKAMSGSIAELSEMSIKNDYEIKDTISNNAFPIKSYKPIDRKKFPKVVMLSDWMRNSENGDMIAEEDEELQN